MILQLYIYITCRGLYQLFYLDNTLLFFIGVNNNIKN
jgi:hypothetical protein